MLGATFSPVRVQSSPLVTYTPVARRQLYVEPETPVWSEPPTSPDVDTPMVYPIVHPPAEFPDAREDLSEDVAPAEGAAAPLRNAIRSPYVLLQCGDGGASKPRPPPSTPACFTCKLTPICACPTSTGTLGGFRRGGDPGVHSCRTYPLGSG